MTLKATHHDNRGDNEVPYGYVYFDDGTRVGYANILENEHDNGIFPTHDSVWWKAATDTKHFRMAAEYLRDQKVKGYE